ncbi:MAG: DeoR/GlpR family DNA-binding transcription regulator [Lachnospiraceae bacterium]|jgi:DeoR family fructose operon transcriptional repressor|nr:DeoR/GlpR family DNA-binding transcription regulator [Lachnospiraceae bacterium]
MLDRKYNIERQSLIVNLLEEKGKVSVNELSQLMQVSKETIRRDLKEMEDAGMIQRTHGGAVLSEASKGVKEYPYLMREIQNYTEKDKLCKEAAKKVRDGDTIFIDNSSTTLNMIQHISPRYQVTIITNSIRLLLDASLQEYSNLTLISLGGIFRASNYSLTGIMASEWINNFRPHKVFLSCCGVNVGEGITDSSIYEVDVKRLMMEKAQEVYVLADATKFGKPGVVFLSDFSKIDYLVTNRGLSPEQEESLKRQGTRLVVVSEQ